MQHVKIYAGFLVRCSEKTKCPGYGVSENAMAPAQNWRGRVVCNFSPEMGKTRSRSGVRVWRFLSDSEWSRSAFFGNLLESEWSLVSNYKIKTKNDARVKCDFDVSTIGFPNFENFGVGVRY